MGRTRGFTVVELLIVLVIVGILASLVGGLVFGVLGWGESSSEIFDESPSARKWAEDLGYTFIAANCSNAPEGLKVSCTVRVEERPEPIGLQCHVGSKKCALLPTVVR